MRVLIVEDDRELAQSLKVALEESGMVAELAVDGQEASFLGSTERYDAAVLDLGLPELDGISVLKQWREQGCNFPVLILTGRGRWSDKLAGFGAGADDYLTKPFNPLELVARVKSQLRRYTELGNVDSRDNQHLYSVGDLVINDETKEVQVGGNTVKLTPIEYNILLLLVKNAGKVFSIDEIYEKIWNEEAIGADNTVAVHIRHIREKIEINPKEPRYLKVVWGVGYKVEKKP